VKADLMTRKIRTPAGDAPVIPVLVMITGGYLCWFAVHYWRSDTKYPTDPLKAVLTGKPIPTPDTSAVANALKSIGATAQPVGDTILGSAHDLAGSAGGSRIASTALSYVGTGYVFGGPADKPGNWDCSSFVSWVLGHDLGMKLPGGKWGDPGFPPHTHGPTTHSYLLFGTPVSHAQARPGDLVVSSEHIGIVLTDGQYVSARTPALGTGVSPLNVGSFPGGSPVFRRVT
jgi:cell wall-associated NlpC family hydrolase